MKPTLITFALEAEARPFRQIRHALVPPILVTGMGSSNADRAFRRALAGPMPARVLTCGFAGGLNPALPQHSVLFSADDGFDLAGALSAAGARPAVFHHADHVIISAAEKRALRQTTGADAVEMESGIIRALCRERGIPSATVRVLSDAAGDDLPLDFNNLLDQDTRLDRGRLVVELLRSPGRIPGLIRMGVSARRAARELARVLGSLFSG